MAGSKPGIRGLEFGESESRFAIPDSRLCHWLVAFGSWLLALGSWLFTAPLHLFARNCYSRKSAQRGQAAMEMALLTPVMMLLMFAVFQLARVFYTYHTLQKAFRGGAGMLARSSTVNYCDPADPTLVNAPNFIVYGNLAATGDPVAQGLTPDMINIVAERVPSVSPGSSPGPCPCDAGGVSGDPDSCDISNGGRAPDFVVVNNSGASAPMGFPVNVLFPFVALTPNTINLQVSVRMAVTGD